MSDVIHECSKKGCFYCSETQRIARLEDPLNNYHPDKILTLLNLYDPTIKDLIDVKKKYSPRSKDSAEKEYKALIAQVTLKAKLEADSKKIAEKNRKGQRVLSKAG